MAYFAPYIDATGLHLPTYNDIISDLVLQAQSIFGGDIYLANDSQDYQFISAVADKIYDTMQLLQDAYNSRSPATAVGAGLAAVVKINGIKPSADTYSTCIVTLGGTAGTTISGGVAQDSNGVKWDLPSSVTIGITGTVDTTVTCEQPGPIAAAPGSINIIATPAYGWDSVTNANAASIGSYADTDASLRVRQAISTQLPSRSLIEGVRGAIANVTGVTRYRVYENQTGNVDSNGLPAHSVTAVVEGGSDSDVAQALFNKKGLGCLTNGTTTVNVTDQYGEVTPVGFYRPTYDDIDVVINVKKLGGYTSQVTTNIINSVVTYLNSLAIGTSLSVSALWGAALSAMPSLQSPLFSVTGITAAKHGQAQGTSDIPVAFNEVTRGNAAYITVNVT